MIMSHLLVMGVLGILALAISWFGVAAIRRLLKEIVPNYRPPAAAD